MNFFPVHCYLFVQIHENVTYLCGQCMVLSEVKGIDWYWIFVGSTKY